MFYKYFPGYAKPLDLRDFYQGCTLVLIGGSPAIKKENIDRVLPGAPVYTMAMNNAAVTYKPDLWVGGDRPECYSPDILHDPSIIKFAGVGRRRDDCHGKLWYSIPNTIFYSATEKDYTINNLFTPHKHLVWWHNTWWVAMTLAYTLGFRTILTIGTGFTMSTSGQYSYATKLRSKEISSNNKLYDKTAQAMNDNRDLFVTQGMHIYNCTSPSILEEAYGYLPLEEAIKVEQRKIPSRDTLQRPHSRKDKL